MLGEDPDSAFLRRGGFNDAGWNDEEDKKLLALVIEFKGGDDKKAVRWAKVAKQLGNERDPVLVRMRYYTHIKVREPSPSSSLDDFQSDGIEDVSSRRRPRARAASNTSPDSSAPSTPRGPSTHPNDDVESTTSTDTTPVHSVERHRSYLSYQYDFSDSELDPSSAGYNYYNTVYPSVSNWEFGPVSQYPHEAIFGAEWNLY